MKFRRNRVFLLRILVSVLGLAALLGTLNLVLQFPPTYDLNSDGLPDIKSRDLGDLDSRGINPDSRENFFNSDQEATNLFRIDFDKETGNYTEFWNSVRKLAGYDTLYPRDYDVTQVTEILQTAKILSADILQTHPSSFKLIIGFEGHQYAVFKVILLERQNQTTKQCNMGCEHPEYEVAGFTLNRMFDLRNMPYTIGRVVSWEKELLPVASKYLRKYFFYRKDKTTGGRTLCVKWNCFAIDPKTYCFQNGMLEGAVIYYLDKDIMFKMGEDLPYHEFHVYGVLKDRDLERLPGDKKFCNSFRERNPLFRTDYRFLDLVDIAIVDYMMTHHDAKYTYLREKGSDIAEFNIMFDFGHAFCNGEAIKVPSLRILAPLMQCCRIRTRLFKAMVQHKDTLEETFLSLTKEDPLHPILLPETMADMILKLRQALSVVDLCRTLDGDSKVFIDL